MLRSARKTARVALVRCSVRTSGIPMRLRSLYGKNAAGPMTCRLKDLDARTGWQDRAQSSIPEAEGRAIAGWTGIPACHGRFHAELAEKQSPQRLVQQVL